MKRMNRSGHVPTILLLVAAIFLVVTSLYSFYLFGDKVNDNARDLLQLQIDLEVSRFYVQQVFEDSVDMAARNFTTITNFRKQFESDVASRNLGIKSTLNFFAKIREGDYDVLDNADGSYNVTLENVFVKSEVGNNEVVKTFDLTVRFDDAGIK